MVIRNHVNVVTTSGNMKSSIFLLLFFYSFISAAQYQISEGTYSKRKDGNGNLTWDYYNMTSWDSSPYKDFYLEKNGTYIINFRLLFPDNYTANPAEKYPLILMLHGTGESGVCTYSCYEESDERYRNNDHQLYHGGFEHLEANRNGEFPGFILIPQNDQDWHPEWISRVVKLVESAIDKWPVDPNRIYIHGLSAGGSATWEIVDLRPDLFAAYLPISGVSDVDYKKLAPIPSWIFQGETDDHPELSWTESKVKNLKDAGGKPRFTVYENLGHAIWNKAFDEPDFFSWMLEQSKLNTFIYGDRTEFCSGEEFEVKIALSAGFEAYQWKKNDQVLTDSINHSLIINDFGKYSGRFKRNGVWSAWSEPVNINKKLPEKPVITFEGSQHLPSLENKSSLKLEVNQSYNAYLWNTGETSSSIEVQDEGNYNVKVWEDKNCDNISSDNVYVSFNKKPTLKIPSDLFVSSSSDSQLTLHWIDTNSEESGYEIYRSDSEGGASTFITKTGQDVETFVDAYLNPDHTYYYRIRAVNDLEVSGYSPIAEGTTASDQENNAIPSNVEVHYRTINSITLKWDKPSANDIDSYEIQVNDQKYTTTDTIITINDLTHGETYGFKIRSKDNAGNFSEYSAQLTETIIVDGLYYDFYAGGTWDNIEEFVGSEIFYSGTTENIDIAIRKEYYDYDDYFAFIFRGYLFIEKAGTYTFYLTSSDGSKLLIDNNLIVDNDNLHDITEKSNQVSLSQGPHFIELFYFERTDEEQLKLELDGPGINRQTIPSGMLTSMKNTNSYQISSPELISAEPLNYYKVEIKWRDNSDNEKFFEIFRSDAGSEFSIIKTMAANETSFIDSSLTADTNYTYKLQAINDNAESEYSNSISVKTPVQPKPPVLTLNSANTINNKTIKVDWDLPEDPTFDQVAIYRSTDDKEYKLVNIVSKSISEFTDSYLEVNTDYFYRVKTLKNDLPSDFSNTVSANTVNSDPEINDLDQIEVTISETLNFSILVNDPDQDSIIFEASFPEFVTVQDTLRSELKLKFTPQQTDLGSHTIIFEVSDLYGGVDKDTLIVHVQEPLSVHKKKFGEAITIYPNPFVDDWVFINFNQLPDLPVVAYLFNNKGQRVASYQLPRNKNQKLDFGKLQQGIYFLSISSREYFQTYKIVKY